MSTRSSDLIYEFDVKFCGKSDQTFQIYSFNSNSLLTLLHEQETLGEWRTATIGQMIRIRVTGTTCEALKMMGDMMQGGSMTGNNPMNG